MARKPDASVRDQSDTARRVDERSHWLEFPGTKYSDVYEYNSAGAILPSH